MTDSSRQKSARHHSLISNVSQILIQSSFSDAVSQVATQLAQNLQSECVSIFFRDKTNKALRRLALAVNVNGVTTSQADGFEFDESYPRDSKSLLYDTFQGERRIINYGPEELRGDEIPKGILQSFQAALPSRRLEHVIIVGIYIGTKRLGAIRVINHLDPGNDYRISAKPFSDADDVAIVTSVGAMLALSFANFRKSVKLLALGKYADRMNESTNEDDAVETCIHSLTTDETGFPLAMWRLYSNDGTSRVVNHCPKRVQLDPNGLPLAGEQGLQVGSASKVAVLNEDNFHYHDWARNNNFEAVYVNKISCADKKFALVVFADSIGDLEGQSRTFLDLSADILESRLRVLHVERGIVGTTKAIRRTVDEARKIANLESPALLLGESGTGKQVIARAIHNFSERRSGPFVTVDSAGLSAEQLERELFGRIVKDDSGSGSRSNGLFHKANGGTIFLDEIANLNLDLQSTLLRVIDEHVIAPVSSNQPKTMNVRVIAATHEDLPRLASTGGFHAELFGRLSHCQLTLPPLRDRRDDIPKLARHFVHQFSKTCESGHKVHDFEANALEALSRYDWPGNARQLRNVVLRAVALANGRTISIDDLPSALVRKSFDESGTVLSMKEFDEKCYRIAFEAATTQRQVADMLGVHISTVRKRAEQYGLRPEGRTSDGSPLFPIESLQLAKATYSYELARKIKDNDEVARILGVSERTVSRMARLAEQKAGAKMED